MYIEWKYIHHSYLSAVQLKDLARIIGSHLHIIGIGIFISWPLKMIYTMNFLIHSLKES